MSAKQSTRESEVGTAHAPKYYEGPVVVEGDVRLHIRYFTYQTEAGLVAGRNNTDIFTIDRSAKAVWMVFKDFNLWMNDYGYFYSGVVGELEGKTFHISARMKHHRANADNKSYEKQLTAEIDADAPMIQSPYKYEVVRAIPEHLLVTRQLIPEDGSTGGVSPGFTVSTLNEHEGKTLVTFYTEHCHRTQNKTEAEALAPYRGTADELIIKFRDHFIPTIKKLVYERASQQSEP